MARGENDAVAQASLVTEPGRVAVRGTMTFATVSALYGDALAAVGHANGPLTVDLAAVERADSAGVALIVEWHRLAKAAGRSLAVVNVPDQVTRLMKVSGLAHLLR